MRLHFNKVIVMIYKLECIKVGEEKKKKKKRRKEIKKFDRGKTEESQIYIRKKDRNRPLNQTIPIKSEKRETRERKQRNQKKEKKEKKEKNFLIKLKLKIVIVLF